MNIEQQPIPVSEQKILQKPPKISRRNFLLAALGGGGLLLYKIIDWEGARGILDGLSNIDFFTALYSSDEISDLSRKAVIVTSKNTVGVTPEKVVQSAKEIESIDFTTLTRVPITDPRVASNFYESSKPLLEIPLPFDITENTRIVVRDIYRQLEGYKITINGLPKDTVIYAPVAGRYSFSQTVNMSGTSCFARISFPDSKGYYRNLIFQFGVSQSLIPENKAPKIPQGSFTWQQENIMVNIGAPLFVLDSKDAPGNWLSDQLAISLSPGAINAKGEQLRDKDGRPLAIFFPLKINTIDNKAVFIKR